MRGCAEPTLLPSLGVTPQARVNDTLQVQGSRLIHVMRQPPTIHHPEGRLLRFEYWEGRPAVPVCGSLPAGN